MSTDAQPAFAGFSPTSGLPVSESNATADGQGVDGMPPKLGTRAEKYETEL